jgi:DNA modification methylase
MFAESYKRDENDLILFPSDVVFRRSLLVNWRDAGLEGDHPAKANLWLTKELIEYTTVPGQRVMDITAGAGSVLVGLTMGRDVVAIEIAPHFANWIKQSYERMIDRGDADKTAFILEGDCRNLMPLAADSIVFSPPYAGAFNSGGGILSRDKALGASVEQYRHDPNNLGNLNNFLFNRAMDQIYKGCFDSLPSGGKLSLLIKDRIEKGNRVQLGLAAVKSMMKAGFVVFEWIRWKPPGSIFVSIKRSKGETVVGDEHIIIMEKPE